MLIVRSILLMILAMALLALSDLFIKLAASRAPIGQVMLYLSLGGTGLFLVLAAILRVRIWDAAYRHPMVMLRNVFEIVGGVGLVLGLASIPLTTFAAIMQVAPILVVMGGALFLGEQVGWRRWAAVLVGLLGMLIVLRPGPEGIQPGAIFAVIGVSGLAARDLVTRLAPARVSALTLSTWGFAATIPAGALLLVLGGDTLVHSGPVMTHLALAVLVTTAGYFSLTTAMRMAPVSIVAPFRYTRLIFTTGLGILFLGERPDVWTMTGAALILAAGLYTFLRERRIALTEERASGTT